MAYVISVTNEKGGVAKTTTTLSLGAALVESGKKVLLIDLDSQANLTLALGLDPTKSPKTIVSMLLEGIKGEALWMETGIPGLFVIPANNEMGFVERILPTRPGYESTIKKNLLTDKNDFDYVLMDCPPFLGAIVLNALTASNLLIIPTQPEYFSIYALKNMMSLIRRVRTQTNPNLTYRLLLTMFDRRNRIHRTMSEQLRSSFTNGVLDSVIMIDTKLRESPVAGLPIIYHSPKSRSAMQYRQLAQEIMKYVEEKVAQPA